MRYRRAVVELSTGTLGLEPTPGERASPQSYRRFDHGRIRKPAQEQLPDAWRTSNDTRESV